MGRLGDLVPQDEIWVKLGGDKGGGSFKMFLQLVNTSHPNSIKNTFVFSVFEGHSNQLPSSFGALQVTGSISSNSVLEVKQKLYLNMTDKCNMEKKIRVFVFGDSEFLGKSYGISGASGKTSINQGFRQV